MNKRKIKFLFYYNKIALFAQNRAIWRIKRKNRSKGLACRRLEESKESVVNFEQEGCIFPYMGSKNPWADWAQIVFGGKSPRYNHAIQIWRQSVEGF